MMKTTKKSSPHIIGHQTQLKGANKGEIMRIDSEMANQNLKTTFIIR